MRNLLDMPPSEFIAYERKDWLISRHIGFREDALTIDFPTSEIAYLPESALIAEKENAARSQIIKKIGIQLGDQYLREGCLALQSGYSFQSAGRELHNKGKIIDISYRNGECITRHTFGITVTTQIFIGSHPKRFECTGNTCMFPLHLACGTDGNAAMLCGDITFSRKWKAIVTRKNNGEYELIKIQE